MAQISELMKDIEELEMLMNQAKRKKVTDIITVEIHKLRTIVSDLRAKEEKLQQSDNSTPAENTTPQQPRRYTTELTTYGWDQSDKFMKIYVTLNGVQNIAKENVTCEYTNSSFKLKVTDLQNKDYQLHIGNLNEEIAQTDCYHKVKTDMVLVMLKKKEPNKTWPYVTKKQEEKKKEKPQLDEKKDPNDGLMDLMKKMYDEGDDEMKRSIAKAWTESQSKRGGPAGETS